MRRTNLLLLISMLFCANIYAQEKGQAYKEYSRSSIASLNIYHPEDSMGQTIFDAFMSIPVPDKFDDHNVNVKYITDSDITGARKRKNGLIKAKLGKILSKKDVEKNANALLTFMNNNDLATYYVAKWFNLHGDSTTDATFNMELVADRGYYNASEIDVKVAQQSARGMALLADAGEELIKNTYVLVNDITYIPEEERAMVRKATVGVLVAILDAVLYGDKAGAMTEGYMKFEDSRTGFALKNHSYLFKLKWDDEVAAKFYSDYYTDEPNEEKILAFFNDTTTFKLEYVGHVFDRDVETGTKGNVNHKRMMEILVTRSIDKNVASLQKEHEEFRVKEPIFEILYNKKGKCIGYAAKIGEKEGIESGSKFEILQRKFDEETGKTTYRRIGTTKATKIWNNKFGAADLGEKGTEDGYTTFKKISAEVLPGMLIREL